MTHHWSQIIENKKYDKEGLSLSGKKNVLIRNCDFSVNKEGGTMLSLSNCQDSRVENCKFHDKDTKGVALKIAGQNTKRIVVKGCEFYNLTYSASNGGEPIRIGNSHSSGCWFDCTVQDSYFHHLAADPETISSKSCGNIIENNRHENCKSSFVIRHGGFCTIRNNRFKGEGGIRVYGYGNIITGNHFEDNQSEKFPPITLGAGNTAKDPNFTAVDKPSGKEGSSHANYAQINKNTIKDNTYKNCKITIKHRTDASLKPINSEIEPLKEVNSAPTPTPIEPAPEPEPEQPQEPALLAFSAPPEEEITRPLCSVCRQEEAVTKLSVYVDAKHKAAMKEKLIQGIKDTRDEEGI